MKTIPKKLNLEKILDEVSAACIFIITSKLKQKRNSITIFNPHQAKNPDPDKTVMIHHDTELSCDLHLYLVSLIRENETIICHLVDIDGNKHPLNLLDLSEYSRARIADYVNEIW